MPTRYLKPGIRDSEAIDALTPIAEVLFYRLIVTVDDFGRADARPAMVKAACFPIREQITANDCAVMLDELARCGLIDLYVVDGKPYLQMRKWDNVPRAKESKFPALSDGCAHVYTDARKSRTHLPVTVTVTETETEPPPPPQSTARDRRDARFAEFWNAWPRNERKQDKAKCVDHWKRNGFDAIADAILADVATKRKTQKWAEGFIEAPLVYLRGKRWEDGVQAAPASQAGIGRPAGVTEALDWRASWKTIVAKGVEIGVGEWKEGDPTPFPAYRAKVEARVFEIEHGEADLEGQARIASIVGGIMRRSA